MDNPFDLGNLTSMLGDMQRRVTDAKAAAGKLESTAQTGNGAVTVTANGAGQLVSVRIQPAALGDVELLEDLIRAAANEALRGAAAQAAGQLEQMTAGILPPGLLGS